MRTFGKTALCLSALAITLLVGSPLLAGEGHDHKSGCSEQKQAKSSPEGEANKEAKCEKGKDGCCDHCCHHQDKNAKGDGKPCADHANCKHGESHAKDGEKAACADHSCCKDGAGCCEGDGKACAEHHEAHAG